MHDIINTLEDYFKSQLNKHKTNAKIMLNKPQSIPEHTDWIESIEKEIEIGKETARQEGKPEEMLEKIAQGRFVKL